MNIIKQSFMKTKLLFIDHLYDLVLICNRVQISILFGINSTVHSKLNTCVTLKVSKIIDIH